MISLLMTAMVMGYVVVSLLMDITKQVSMGGKRFSMVATFNLTQLKIFVEKIFARLQRMTTLTMMMLMMTTILPMMIIIDSFNRMGEENYIFFHVFISQ